jgi:penicillin V acylase-like amidase (Ntn superfamily)
VNHQVLVYVDDVNLLAGNITAINKNTGALTDTINEAGLDVNTEYLHVDVSSPDYKEKS